MEELDVLYLQGLQGPARWKNLKRLQRQHVKGEVQEVAGEHPKIDSSPAPYESPAPPMQVRAWRFLDFRLLYLCISISHCHRLKSAVDA